MKLKKLFCLGALVLGMGAFSIPVFATEAADTTPPILSAKIQGEALQIAVSDTDSGVEAVFVNGDRVNYRIDSGLELAVTDYMGENGYITLYAMDFAGNTSEEVRVTVSGSTTPNAPAEPTILTTLKEKKPFTPAGNGTVQDNTTEDGKEFFTITTPDDNEFFLVIDRQRESENVYLLNSVTEDDLRALAVKDKKAEVAPTPEPTPEPAPEPEPKPQKRNSGAIVFILLLAAAGGGAGYYFKIYKPKQQPSVTDDDDDDDYDEDWDGESDSPADESDTPKEE